MLVRVTGPHAEFGMCWGGRDYAHGDLLEIADVYVPSLVRQGWVEPVSVAPPDAGTVATASVMVESRDVPPRRRRTR